MKIIDPHLHLFDLNQGDYFWLQENNPPFWPDKHLISKNFSEQDLTLSSPFELAGFIHIEAGFNNQQPWQEIIWLENYCKLPFRSIAFIDITLNESQFSKQLTKLKGFSSVVGCRYILGEQALDEQAQKLLSSNTVKNNLKALAKAELIFEVQMSLCDVKAVAELSRVLAENIQLQVVINHAGWPPERAINEASISTSTSASTSTQTTSAWQSWQLSLTELAKYPQVSIKCSGWEMASSCNSNSNGLSSKKVSRKDSSRSYSQPWQVQVLKACLSAFGNERVMLASNFPLCLFSGSYQGLWQEYHQSALEVDLSEHQLTQISLQNAQNIYKLFC